MDTLDETIRSILVDFHQTVLPTVGAGLVRRDLRLGTPLQPTIGNLAKTVTGVRRCGKTFRLYQEVAGLLDGGVDPGRICYFNFDDDRLRPFPEDMLARVLEAFFTLHPLSRRDGAYLFLDEVQDVPDWDMTARRIVDTEKVSMYLTGSSSKMLSEDIATQFRGRSVSYELAPYDFGEYARASGAATDADLVGDALDNKENTSRLKSAFEAYLRCGGFPGVVGLDDLERIQVLQGYAQIAVARDVVERRNYPNASFVRNLARIAVASSARDFSISRIDHQAKSQGYSPGRERIGDMLEAFEDAHLAYGVYDFSRSAARSRLGGYKLYAVDTGLLLAMAPATTDGLARALETAVYLELRRNRASGRIGEVSLLKLDSGKEVDFVWGDEAFGQAYSLVQVCVDMRDEHTRRRELSALDEALALFPDAPAAVVTLDESGVERLEHGSVRIVPAWRWMLEQEASRS